VILAKANIDRKIQGVMKFFVLKEEQAAQNQTKLREQLQ
jgi:hypothetical protein